MTLTIRAAQLFIILLIICLTYVVMSRRVKMPLLIEWGITLLAFSAVGALDSLLSESPFTPIDFVAARWLLSGVGSAMIAGYVAWTLLHVNKRVLKSKVTDFVAIDENVPALVPRKHNERFGDVQDQLK